MVKTGESVILINRRVGNRRLFGYRTGMSTIGLRTTQSNSCLLGCESNLRKSFCLLLFLDSFECRFLIKENIGTCHARFVAEEIPHVMLVHWLNHLIVKQEPASILCLDDGNVVSVVRISPNMHYNSVELI